MEKLGWVIEGGILQLFFILREWPFNIKGAVMRYLFWKKNNFSQNCIQNNNNKKIIKSEENNSFSMSMKFRLGRKTKYPLKSLMVLTENYLVCSRGRFARYVHVRSWNFLFCCSGIAKSESAGLWEGIWFSSRVWISLTWKNCYFLQILLFFYYYYFVYNFARNCFFFKKSIA
jgi:hypothetical protein